MARNTVQTLRQMADRGEKITMVTSYDFTMATLVEQAEINMILVGDSLGMTMMGYNDTLPVSMNDMVHHTRCVTRATTNTFVVADMPFMSYQSSVEQAVDNAGRLMKEGQAQAVKLEGGVAIHDQIRAIVDAGIPVVGHIGMTPQSQNAFGGFKVQGKNLAAAQRVLDDALAVQDAGAFAVVLECVPADLATYVSEQLTTTFTIGIGAGNGTDGQVLVCQDLLGITPGGFKPKFVRNFASLSEQIIAAYHAYSDAVKDGSFPAPAHTFTIKSEVMQELKRAHEDA